MGLYGLAVAVVCGVNVFCFISVCVNMCVFFFFQAEDGIRDLTVTGVQTCALPISGAPLAPGEKLYCVSYTPFRGRQSPLEPATLIDPRQIEDDMVRLRRLTDCVRDRKSVV